MLHALDLKRPLAFLDTETTGINTRQDRIIDISILWYLPGGGSYQKTRRLNPLIPIPADSTEIHGITDADVMNCPTFPQIAGSLIDQLDGCDISGFNVYFDLQILCHEFERHNHVFKVMGRKILDLKEIFHKRERRDLSAAVQFYCHQTHEGAHGAAADVSVCPQILDGMFYRYKDLPHDLDSLTEMFSSGEKVDLSGFFKKNKEGEIVFARGKHSGKKAVEAVKEDRNYFEWATGNGDFLLDTRAVFSAVMRSVYPED